MRLSSEEINLIKSSIEKLDVHAHEYIDEELEKLFDDLLLYPRKISLTVARVAKVLEIQGFTSYFSFIRTPRALPSVHLTLAAGLTDFSRFIVLLSFRSQKQPCSTLKTNTPLINYYYKSIDLLLTVLRYSQTVYY